MLNKIKLLWSRLFKKTHVETHLVEDVFAFMKSFPRINFVKLRRRDYQTYKCDKCKLDFVDKPRNRIAEELSDDEVKFGYTLCHDCTYKQHKTVMQNYTEPVLPFDRDYTFICSTRDAKAKVPVYKCEHVVFPLQFVCIRDLNLEEMQYVNSTD